ncbi:MAG: WYL domain-containing protein [Chloroflexi bacterium]|nr:WYL domain-containing protein [Chloroflexota bacterium]
MAAAWVSRHCVRITYRALDADKANERIVDPYFIEPAAAGHSSYVVAYCHRAREVRTFKVERIEDIQETSETYVIPPDFDANTYFKPAWGITVEGEVATVRLKFVHELARLMEETVWHPSQILEKQSDGSVIMTLKVFDTREFCSWILGWGEKVEVLEPDSLKRAVAETAVAMLGVYAGKVKML